MVPHEIESLLFAGRLACADLAAFASVRVMPQCMAMGEAAGIAATIARDRSLTVQVLDTADIIAALAARGVRGISGEAPSDYALALKAFLGS